METINPIYHEHNKTLFDEHIHQFTIPVEWGTDDISSLFNDGWVVRRFVIKLMCPCGEEKERK